MLGWVLAVPCMHNQFAVLRYGCWKLLEHDHLSIKLVWRYIHAGFPEIRLENEPEFRESALLLQGRNLLNRLD